MSKKQPRPPTPARTRVFPALDQGNPGAWLTADALEASLTGVSSPGGRAGVPRRGANLPVDGDLGAGSTEPIDPPGASGPERKPR